MARRKSPYARGFRPPQQEDIDQALGDDDPYSMDFKASFDPLPVPSHDYDWLATYNEKGQTYPEFLDGCPLLDADDQSRDTIYLTLLDGEDRSSLLDIDRLVDYTQRFFQTPVKLIPLFTKLVWNDRKQTWTCTMKVRKDSTKDTELRARYDVTTEHSQICVNHVLTLMKRAVPSDARCLVAITLHDFYSDPSDLFIAGLSHGNCRVAAFSFFRYDSRLTFGDEFWYDWKLKATRSPSIQKTILLRSCRLLTHEIGHLLGVDHCIYYACLMNGSGHLQEDFSQPLFLCPVDLRKLTKLADFDLAERYERLLEFCIENDFTDDIHLLKRRLELLKREQTLVSARRKRKSDDLRPRAIRKRVKK